MANCINVNSIEFKNNLKQSGLSESEYAIEVTAYFNKQRRLGVKEEDLQYPKLDQIDNADSSAYLSQNIKLKDNGAFISDILNYTGSDNIQSATIQINDKHRDLEVDIIPLKEEALVNIEHRPNDLVDKGNPIVSITHDKMALIPSFNKLSKLYGIKFNNVTIDDLISDQKFKFVPNAKHTNAFILDGEIYINMDVADVDAPIHELTHLLLGGVKFQNPGLYNALVNTSEQLPYYNTLVAQYPNRTRSDINEEIFVTEFAKFLTNKSSIIEQLPEYVQHEILYNVRRLLDSMMMGDVSVKTISPSKLVNLSLTKIASIVNSPMFENNSRSILTDGVIHRMLNNRKSDLMNKNELKEVCL